MAKPIITTDNVGCKETVLNNWNGFKIPVKDAEQLCIALEKMILLSKEQFIQFGNNSRMLAIEKFNEKGILKLYVSLANKYYQNTYNSSAIHS